MVLWLLAYVGGFLTILSPCILPVLPFVFARSDRGFFKNNLPVLAGLAVTFTGVSVLALAGGAWVVKANQWGRTGALVLMSLFALSLIFPALLERITAPLTRVGGRLSAKKESSRPGQAFVIGIATGLLWAPCAGPILGLILTGAATQKSSGSAVLFLFAYALGACSSLALALVAGGKFMGRMKKFLKAEGPVKKIAGGLVLLGVLSIALNWDRSVLTQLSRLQTDGVEQKLIQMFSHEDKSQFADEGKMPAFSGVTQWLNSPPLTAESLKGKVVLVDFWTYSCINCLRTLPYIKAWSEKYQSAGLVVIGVHTPEFGFEKDLGNIEKAVQDLGIKYPVAVDNDYAVWNAYGNEYWPAHYFIDREGHVRHHHFGEGDYAESEKILQELLGEKAGSLVTDQGSGVQAPASGDNTISPETYVGYERAENFQGMNTLKKDQAAKYTASASQLQANQWTLDGSWKITEESATLVNSPGKIFYRFRARDLNLVLGQVAGSDGNSKIAYRVRIDGQEPGANHGVDSDAKGDGEVKENRLYQLIRLQDKGDLREHLFEIEFTAPVQVFAFTFG